MSEVKAQGAPDRVGLRPRIAILSRYDERDIFKRVEYIRADIARELAEALRFLEQDRHIHIASDDGDACRGCGLDLRNLIHYRLDESASTDKARARAALAKWREATEETE